MIELEQARGLLARAVLTKGPDFRYIPLGSFKQCYYCPMNGNENDFENDDPRNETGCLIGVALSLSGETRHLNLMGVITEIYHGMMTEEAALYFAQAQRAQDSGHTWGQAYEASETWMRTRTNSIPS